MISTKNTTLCLTLLLGLGPHLCSCVSSEDGQIGASLPLECYPEIIDEPPPPPGPCKDDVSCRQARSRGTPWKTREWLALSLPSDPECERDSPPFALRKEQGDCVVSLLANAVPAIAGALCQPTLVHEFAATFADTEVHLTRLAINGVSQSALGPALRWRAPNWRASYAWQIQEAQLCEPLATPPSDDALVEIELRIQLEAWLRMQGLEEVRLVVPRLARGEP